MALLNAKATMIQKVWKGHLQRKKYLRIRKATVKIQECYLGKENKRVSLVCKGYFYIINISAWRSRIRFRRQRRAAVVIQAHLRGMFAREVANALREAKRVEEERRRKEKLEEERRKVQEQKEKEELENKVYIYLYIYGIYERI